MTSGYYIQTMLSPTSYTVQYSWIASQLQRKQELQNLFNETATTHQLYIRSSTCTISQLRESVCGQNWGFEGYSTNPYSEYGQCCEQNAADQQSESCGDEKRIVDVDGKGVRSRGCSIGRVEYDEGTTGRMSMKSGGRVLGHLLFRLLVPSHRSLVRSHRSLVRSRAHSLIPKFLG